ncbi:hypothetical protein [Ohtaekwangia sp.]|uniref:hypothetical protein n=1 Tax=Ohtaekwangia sp. TaxID=2066019 RepID=UPI002F91C40D
MKSSIVSIALVYIVFGATHVLAQTGLEQYYYVQKQKPVEFVPIVSYQTRSNWYAEARYNYEENNTFSLYAGKTFEGTHKKFNYSFTPILGSVFGEFRGASTGVNVAMDLKNLFFSSQAQYTFSPGNPESDFWFSWSELGYEVSPWLYFGLSMQHTHMLQGNANQLEQGAVVGFSFGKWTVPIYSFSTFSSSRYFVLGINLGIGSNKKA